MLSSITRFLTKPLQARAYSTFSMPMRLRVQRAPTRATDHNVGKGTAAFNEREAALENKSVKDHETATIQRLRDEAKVRIEGLKRGFFRFSNFANKHTFAFSALHHLLSAFLV
jgi:hypothetical protein